MVSQFQDCYLSFTGTHWNVDVALGCSRTRWEKGGEREERLERAGMLYSNYRLFAEVVCLSDTPHAKKMLRYVYTRNIRKKYMEV